MAQQLLKCVELAGHQAQVASSLRAYLGDPNDHVGWERLCCDAKAESERIGAQWAKNGPPDVWLCYHPYYKAPDLLGPDLAQRFGLPYVSLEASLSARRNIGIWSNMQTCVRAAVQAARLNLCLTARDAAGLRQMVPTAQIERFPPFIETEAFMAPALPQPGHLVTVAMMRAGDKAESYRRLAALLAHLPADLNWHLTVVGDGPLRAEVRAMFVDLPTGRITWAGQLARPQIAAVLSRASVYVWPGCGEAYGLAYLEAQAAGVPVVAQRVAGVPEVVADGIAGFLTDMGDDAAAAKAVVRLMADAALQRRMGQAARARVMQDHSLAGATERLNSVLHIVTKSKS